MLKQLPDAPPRRRRSTVVILIVLLLLLVVDEVAVLVDALIRPLTYGTFRPRGRTFADGYHAAAAGADEGSAEAASAPGPGPAHLPENNKNKPQWITCSSTNELAAAVRSFVRPHDYVAELGAQLRSVSQAICESLVAESGGKAVLVDVARKFPSNRRPQHQTRAMRRPGEETNLPKLATFIEMAQLDDWRHVFGNQSSHYDVFVLDLNSIVGNDLEWTSLSLILEFSSLFSSRSVLVKSLNLNQWSSRLIHGQRWMNLHRGTYTDIVMPPPHIVTTVGVQEYRRTIPFTVRPGDAVLELGCHFGTTTSVLHQACDRSGLCLGVDVGPKIILEAKERHPQIHFTVGDAWKTAELVRKHREMAATGQGSLSSSSSGWDVVYIDVGGLSGSDGLLEAIVLVSSLMYALEPRCIVIKSLCLQRLSSTMQPFWRTLKKREAL